MRLGSRSTPWRRSSSVRSGPEQPQLGAVAWCSTVSVPAARLQDGLKLAVGPKQHNADPGRALAARHPPNNRELPAPKEARAVS